MNTAQEPSTFELLMRRLGAEAEDARVIAADAREIVGSVRGLGSQLRADPIGRGRRLVRDLLTFKAKGG